MDDIAGSKWLRKTTVLRYLAGLLDDEDWVAGTLTISDELPLTDRIAYMARQDLLLTAMASVIDNVMPQSSRKISF
ncbi:hypothetical protein O9992_30955 [Vibrio lentus]|nr:hypothetical protein [Vibrio lentus]